MAYNSKTIKAHSSNYGAKRKKDDVKYLVYHNTRADNKKDTAIANANYFKQNLKANGNNVASAHTFVDDTTVVHSVDGLNVAYSVAGGLMDQCSPYAKKGAKMYQRITNSNSYSIEICNCLDKNNKFSAATRRNAVILGAKVLKKYGIPMDNVYRHFDVNGKLCPIKFVTDEDDWSKFKKELATEYLGLVKKINKDSGKYLIKMLQKKLNTIDVGLTKLTVDGVYGDSTKLYVLAVWNLWGWNKNGSRNGKTAGVKTLKQLGLIK